MLLPAPDVVLMRTAATYLTSWRRSVRVRAKRIGRSVPTCALFNASGHDRSSVGRETYRRDMLTPSTHMRTVQRNVFPQVGTSNTKVFARGMTVRRSNAESSRMRTYY